ncbi:MAG: GNAT family N-acetyltransferase [Opitutus sp.]
MDSRPTVPWLIRPAQPHEAAALTEIAFAAKRSWGYPEAWIQQWAESLTVTDTFIREHATFVASMDRVTVGFAALVQGVKTAERSVSRLEHLWVRPEWMGRGIGRSLFAAGEAVAREAGSDVLTIESDPHAEAFYQRQGAITVGQIPADIEGVSRFLAQMEKRLR